MTELDFLGDEEKKGSKGLFNIIRTLLEGRIISGTLECINYINIEYFYSKTINII